MSDPREGGEDGPEVVEGVRIVGPDEMAQAMDREDVQRRLPSDAPRPGGRPPRPTPGRPPPALRFPLDSSADADPGLSASPPPGGGGRPASGPAHWEAPGYQEVPHMSPHDPYEGDDDGNWSAFAGAGPRWRDDEPHSMAGGRPRRPRPSQQGEPLSFDDYQEPGRGSSVFDPGPPPPPGTPGGFRPYGDPYSDRGFVDHGYDDQMGGTFDTYDDGYVDEPYEDLVAPVTQPPPAGGAARARPKARRPAPSSGGGGDRDMRKAVGVGVGLVALALVLFNIDPLAVVVLVTALLVVASLEYFAVTQKAGFDPLMPVGVTATAVMPIAAYYHAERALPLVLVLTLAVCLVWYIVGAGGAHPVSNIGVTLLGVCWVGLLGSFAALLLASPNGEAMLVAAIVPTVGYDVGALFVGRSAGSRPLSETSPNKTKEGLAGGVVLAIVAGLLLGMLGPHPFDFGDGLLIGLVVALVVPFGDLSESLIKRDLGIKDMGTLLPGHGGVLDRFDGLLYALPAVWYLSTVTDGFGGWFG